MSDEVLIEMEELCQEYSESSFPALCNALIPWVRRKLIEARMDEHLKANVCDDPENCPRWQELKKELEAAQ